jgi:hypothetical protein
MVAKIAPTSKNAIAKRADPSLCASDQNPAMARSTVQAGKVEPRIQPIRERTSSAQDKIAKYTKAATITSRASGGGNVKSLDPMPMVRITERTVTNRIRAMGESGSFRGDDGIFGFIF